MGTGWPKGITYHQHESILTGERIGCPFARNWDTDTEWRLESTGWKLAPSSPLQPVIDSYLRLDALPELPEDVAAKLPPLP